MDDVLILENGVVCAHERHEKKLDWDDARLYCSLLTIDGYDDWRMPTISELHYLSGMSLDECVGKYYWSSECKDDNSVCVQFIDKKLSKRHQTYQYKSNQYFIRPVRNAI